MRLAELIGKYVSFKQGSVWCYGEVIDYTVYTGNWYLLIACHSEKGTRFHRRKYDGVVVKDQRHLNEKGLV